MSNITVLIVEDEAIVAADLAGKLKGLGYEVAGTAARGEEAVALADRLRPQLVLMDIRLKGAMDGIEASAAIRCQHDIPVIYLTAHSDAATLARAKLTGPFGYVLKPFDERDLATQIEMALYRHQADRQLREQREWLQVTLTSIGDAVIATDAAACVTFVNPVAEALTGWTADEAAGKPVQCVFRIVNEQTGKPLEEPVAHVLRERRAVELANHAALVTKDGRAVPIEDSAAPILDATGQVIGAVLVFHDVTEKRRAEQAIEQRNVELQATIEELKAAEEEIAAQNEEMLQQNDELVAAHSSLAAERQRYEELFEAAPDGYLVTDHQGVILQANRAALAMLGRPPQAVPGTPLVTFVEPGQRPAFLHAIRAVQQGMGEGPLEFRIAPISGNSFEAELTAALAQRTNESPAVPQVRWMLRDITERKRREVQIAKLTRLYAVLSRVNEAIVRARSAETLCSEVCRIVAEIGEFPLVWIGEVRGRRVVPVAHAGVAGEYLEGIQIEIDGPLGVGPGGTCIREDRTVVNDNFFVNPQAAPWRAAALRFGFLASAAFPLRRNGKPVAELTLYGREAGAFDAEQVGLLESLSADLSYALDALDHEEVRARAEAALHESREKLRLALRSASMGVWRLDLRSQERHFDEQVCRCLGIDPAHFAGTEEEFFAAVHPEDCDALRNALARTIASGAAYEAEYRAIWPDGSLHYIAARGQLARDAAGQPQWIDGLVWDVTDRKQTEQALKSAKAAAEAANEAKSQFLANMSHELRTPMNAILGMIDVALPKATDPTVHDCLQTAKGSADLLLTLLNDLLDSAKVEAGKLELESAPFSLRRMLDQITRVLAVRASEKGLAFYCRVPDETPDVVTGDRMRLQQILLNLAGNAIKFTERGEVEIRLRAPSHNGETHLEFAVQDTGIGIPPSGLERLFHPFAQADASMSRRFGGTGLGLSISKSLVELMGGTISVESELGKGSTFHVTVCLPLSEELPSDFEAPVAIPAAASAQLRVLLVEDNPANQKLATYILQDRGHTVEIAGDGQEAIYLTEQDRYDVILMDVQMPGMNGLEATAAIRKREDGGRRVPIIAMTAHVMRGDRERCLAAGMNGYLSKPVNAQEMIGLVESLARGRGARDAATRNSVETSHQAAAVVFDPEEALSRCFNSADMVREMSQCFFDEVEHLFPQLRAALKQGDLGEVGRLGHRLKGTVVYLGAQPATEAARRVERFCKPSGGTPSEAEEAINALEHECIVLKAALSKHPLAAEPA
jgi:PAS domain S-box-containing protein